MEKIKKFIYDVKSNKPALFTQTIFSIFLAFTIMLDKMLIFNNPNSVFWGLDAKRFNEWNIKYLPVFLATFFISMFIILIIEFFYDILKKYFYSNKNLNTKKEENSKIFLMCFLIILMCWMPYILSFFPGGIFSDTKSSIEQAIGLKAYKNDNPIFYALLFKMIFDICKIFSNNVSLQLVMEIFTVLQLIAFISTYSYFIVWLNKKGVKKLYLIFTLLFFSLFNLIPLYALSIWKDCPFIISLFWLGMLIASIVLNNGENLKHIKFIILYVLVNLLVIFTRNNGIIIVVLTNIILSIMYEKLIMKNAKIFFIITWTTTIISLIITGPIYKKHNMGLDFVESVGIQLQQICYVVATDGNINEEQYKFINQLSNVDYIKKHYNSGIVDTIKWGGINNEFLNNHKKEFINLWKDLFIQNKKAYIKAYFLNTVGFWDINKATFDGYYCPRMWGDTDNYIGVIQYDILKQITGKSMQQKLYSKKPISSAVFLILMLLGMQLTIYEKKYRNLIIYIPAFGAWTSIMLGVPLAFSFRYVSILMLYIPFDFIIPLLTNNLFKGKI